MQCILYSKPARSCTVDVVFQFLVVVIMCLLIFVCIGYSWKSTSVLQVANCHRQWTWRWCFWEKCYFRFDTKVSVWLLLFLLIHLTCLGYRSRLTWGNVRRGEDWPTCLNKRDKTFFSKNAEDNNNKTSRILRVVHTFIITSHYKKCYKKIHNYSLAKYIK